VTGETTTVRSPAGYTDVSTWSTTGTPYTNGSTRVRQTYRQGSSGGNVSVRTETYEFNSSLGDFRRKTVAEANGSTTTFTYDPAHADRITLETRSAPGGLITVGAHTTGYAYDADGRVQFEFRPGPNWTGTPACAPATADATCTTTAHSYDYFGRQVSTGEVSGPDTRTRVTRYSAFDEVIVTRDPANLARATYYNNRGQRDYEYTCQYSVTAPGCSGPLCAFGNAALPPTGCSLLSESLFEYHPLSGKPTRERVVLSDVVPFAFSTVPASTADTVSTYDAQTGRWLQSVSVGGLSPTTYGYDDQGRVKRRTTATGVATDSEFDGRGFVKATKVWNPSTGATPSLQTTNDYTSDGQLLATTDSADVRTQYGYNAVGRRVTVLRCGENNPSCASPLSRTQSLYDTSGNVVRQFVVDEDGQGLADTATDYDNWSRPYRVRRRVHFNESTATNDDTEDDDGVADEVTATTYNAAGLVKRIARRALSVTTDVNPATDTIVENDYNAFGELLHIMRPAEDLFGADITEITQYVPDFAGRVLSKRQCKDAPDATGNCAVGTASLWDYTYDATGRVKTVIDPEGHSVESFYDSRGHLNRRVSSEQPTPGNRTGLGVIASAQQRWA